MLAQELTIGLTCAAAILGKLNGSEHLRAGTSLCFELAG
jgi:hypothetical protein